MKPRNVFVSLLCGLAIFVCVSHARDQHKHQESPLELAQDASLKMELAKCKQTIDWLISENQRQAERHDKAVLALQQQLTQHQQALLRQAEALSKAKTSVDVEGAAIHARIDQTVAKLSAADDRLTKEQTQQGDVLRTTAKQDQLNATNKMLATLTDRVAATERSVTEVDKTVKPQIAALEKKTSKITDEGGCIRMGDRILAFQGDGNLVIYHNGRALWASHTSPPPPTPPSTYRDRPSR